MAMRAAILTVSDKGSRGARADTSGDAIAELLTGAGAEIARRDIVPDERWRIAQVLREWADAGVVDLIVTTGGTGLAARDVLRDLGAADADRVAAHMLPWPVAN